VSPCGIILKRDGEQELQYYEEIYGRYLRNEAQSEVAKATRGEKDLP
jgi:glutathione S-transferase